MNQRSLPLTHMISLGNQASLKNTDFINYLINKKEVRAFGLHIESIENISDFEVAAKLISTSPTIGDTIITHRFPLHEAEEAFNVAQDKSSKCIKVVFDPNS